MKWINQWFFWMAVIIIPLGAMVAFWLHGQRKGGEVNGRPSRRLTVPDGKWPLMARPILNTAERSVWMQLLQIFPEKLIMVKLPLARFTLPRKGERASDWFEILSGLYCTFAVCNDEGKVLGCVDVAGPAGISEDNSNLKHQLLAQCGIAYCLVQPGAALPAAEVLRSRFLGIHDGDSSDLARLQQARRQLHRALDRNRNTRHDQGAWQQNDSFLAPFDSRHNRLSR